MTPDIVPTQHELRSQATRARILAAAHNQFVANGLEGTRMEAIAAEAEVNKSLVYRHFGNRETLYKAVIGWAYSRIRDAEGALIIPDDPIEAVFVMIDFTLEYYLSNPDFLVLIGIENLHRGEYLRTVDRDLLQISRLTERYQTVIDRGLKVGMFRSDLDAVELYMVVASQCWFAIATRYTFGITFDINVLEEKELEKRVSIIRRAVLGFVLKDINVDAHLSAPKKTRQK